MTPTRAWRAVSATGSPPPLELGEATSTMRPKPARFIVGAQACASQNPVSTPMAMTARQLSWSMLSGASSSGASAVAAVWISTSIRPSVSTT